MRPRTQAWKLFVTLLYGEYGWIRRAPQGHVTVPVRALADHLGRRPPTLHEDIAFLFKMALIRDVDWQGHYFTCTLSPPKDSEWKKREIVYDEVSGI